MQRYLSSFLATCLVAPALAAAQQAPVPVTLPMDLLGSAVVPGVLEYQPRSFDLTQLASYEDVLVSGWPVPGGQAVSLELERVRHDWSGTKRYVDGQAQPFDLGDQTCWRGQVAGQTPGSAWVCFSSYGCYGWYEVDGDLYHLSSFVPDGGDWSSAGARFYSEELNQTLPNINPREFECQVDRGLPLDQRQTTPVAPSIPTEPGPLGGLTMLECTVAVETDYQYFQNFGNLTAATNFITQLLAAISSRYEEQVFVVLTYPYLGMYTSNNDPWTEQSGGAGAMLTQFRQAWDNGNIPEDAHLGHFCSGAGLGGGVAYVDVLCSNNWGFGVSGGINGGVNFPVDQGGDTWDFVVIAHELGHNFGTSHTHNYSPPIDTCGISGGTCINSGTIMSYCHTCPGGMNNITTYFHPIVVNNMRADAEQSCIPNYVPPCFEEGFEENDSCGAQAALVGPGVFEGGQAVSGDDDWYEVQVAPGEAIEFQVTFDQTLGDIDVELLDSFCSGVVDTGLDQQGIEIVSWSNQASSTQSVYLKVELAAPVPCNLYQLAIANVADPCDDNFDAFEPNDACTEPAALFSGLYTNLSVATDDPDYYEICLAPGQTFSVDALYDVVDGEVDMVVIPGADCLGIPVGGATNVPTGKHLDFTNPSATEPAEILLVVTVAPSSQHPCVAHTLIAAYQHGDCSPPPPPPPPPIGPVGSTYCAPGNDNSTGVPALISAFGSSQVALMDVELTASQLPPNQFCFFLASQSQGLVMNPGGSAGILCLGGDIGRYQDQVASSGPSGTVSIALDLNSIPVNPPQAVMAGDTWYFQAWYRDVFIGVPTSNFTPGLVIHFD